MKYLGEGGVNLFQKIAMLVADYKEENGAENLINIGSGEPDLTPPKRLQELVAAEVLKDDQRIHTYQENNSKNKLNQNFIELNTGVNIDEYDHISSQILPGEKTTLGLLPIACGANRTDVQIDNDGFMVNAPSYDITRTWSEYLGEKSFVWPMYADENFALNIKHIPEGAKPRMILVVKPGNPCPVGAQKQEWIDLIEYCIKNNIRLVNDGAYTALTHTSHVTLTEVAKDYPDLEWIELLSISKTFSACGWRLGMAVGSNDFISELAKVKGNTDSGPFGPLISGMEKYLETPQAKIDAKKNQEIYQKRLEILRGVFTEFGLHPACNTDAGFFMMFDCPKFINGKAVENSEDYNKQIITLIGVVGVPFQGQKGEQFIRYSACYDAFDEAKIAKLKSVLSTVEISY
ncbi:aminotransferase class I/II-fold pyridoxal phosphate-dependent enzyme [Candidatus Gracilibacteria bacterium]|nr:aminotransferase class I/II-fold pyridoxal phosphate-dependent enzyme [Candidatus Gracilibacteria bacterium]